MGRKNRNRAPKQKQKKQQKKGRDRKRQNSNSKPVRQPPAVQPTPEAVPASPSPTLQKIITRHILVAAATIWTTTTRAKPIWIRVASIRLSKPKSFTTTPTPPSGNTKATSHAMLNILTTVYFLLVLIIWMLLSPRSVSSPAYILTAWEKPLVFIPSMLFILGPSIGGRKWALRLLAASFLVWWYCWAFGDLYGMLRERKVEFGVFVSAWMASGVMLVAVWEEEERYLALEMERLKRVGVPLEMFWAAAGVKESESPVYLDVADADADVGDGIDVDTDAGADTGADFAGEDDEIEIEIEKEAAEEDEELVEEDEEVKRQKKRDKKKRHRENKKKRKEEEEMLRKEQNMKKKKRA